MRRRSRRGRAIRRRYGRARAVHSAHQTAYGTYVRGHRIVSESGKVLAVFNSEPEAIRAWDLLASFEGRWGDSADTFDSAQWRGLRASWKARGISED